MFVVILWKTFYFSSNCHLTIFYQLSVKTVKESSQHNFESTFANTPHKYLLLSRKQTKLKLSEIDKQNKKKWFPVTWNFPVSNEWQLCAVLSGFSNVVLDIAQNILQRLNT